MPLTDDQIKDEQMTLDEERATPDQACNLLVALAKKQGIEEAPRDYPRKEEYPARIASQVEAHAQDLLTKLKVTPEPEQSSMMVLLLWAIREKHLLPSYMEWEEEILTALEDLECASREKVRFNLLESEYPEDPEQKAEPVNLDKFLAESDPVEAAGELMVAIQDVLVARLLGRKYRDIPSS